MITIVMMMKVQQFYHRVVNGEDQVCIIPNLPEVANLKRLSRDAIDQNIWTLMECRIARFDKIWEQHWPITIQDMRFD